MAVLSQDGQGPVITVYPQGDIIPYNTAVTLTVEATGTPPLHYAWHQIVNETFIPVGTDSPEYTTPPLTANSTFSVSVNNDFGGSGSGRIEITIGVPAHFPLWPPQPCCDETLYEGDSAFLMAVALGTEPIHLQWYIGTSGDTSTPVGPNEPFYNTPELHTTTRYWVRTSNEFGQEDSDTITITVLPHPIELVTNGSFENGLTGWKIRQQSGDKVICKAGFAADGLCAFTFKGQGLLKTVILLDPPAMPGDKLLYQWKAKGTGFATTVTIQEFAAETGEKLNTFKRNLGNGGYMTFLASYSPTTNVGKIVIKFVNIWTTGRVRIDAVSAVRQMPPLRNVLPLPSAPVQ
jgi:hypothetical protein